MFVPVNWNERLIYGPATNEQITDRDLLACGFAMLPSPALPGEVSPPLCVAMGGVLGGSDAVVQCDHRIGSSDASTRFSSMDNRGKNTCRQSTLYAPIVSPGIQYKDCHSNKVEVRPPRPWGGACSIRQSRQHPLHSRCRDTWELSVGSFYQLGSSAADSVS
jgi:hypothetical protein